MGIGYRIKQARELLGYTQKELAEKVGVTSSAITNYENETSHPKENVMYALMEALKVDANFLFQDCVKTVKSLDTATPVEMEYLVKKYRLLDRYGKEAVDTILNIEYNRCMDDLNNTEPEDPVIYLSHPTQPASAGSGLYTDDDDADQVEVIYNSFTSKADFILTVSGDSMEPEFSDGDWVLVRSQPAVEIGEIGVYFIDGSQYIKEYRGTYLHSLNPKYDDVPCDDDTVCRGKVIGLLDESWIR